jgi:hypothetical protein
MRKTEKSDFPSGLLALVAAGFASLFFIPPAKVIDSPKPRGVTVVVEDLRSFYPSKKVRRSRIPVDLLEGAIEEGLRRRVEAFRR